MIGNLIGNSKKAIVKVSKLHDIGQNIGSNNLKLLTGLNVLHLWIRLFILTTSNYLDAKYKINLLRQLEKATCRHESGREEKPWKYKHGTNFPTQHDKMFMYFYPEIIRGI